MGVARSSFYDAADADMADDTALVARMQAVQDQCPAYGYRRITAELRAQGTLANHKRVARLMRLHGMQIRPRRRYVATTNSNHDGPIFPNLAKDLTPVGPDQLWVSDITFIAIGKRPTKTAGLAQAAIRLSRRARRSVVFHGSRPATRLTG